MTVRYLIINVYPRNVCYWNSLYFRNLKQWYHRIRAQHLYLVSHDIT